MTNGTFNTILFKWEDATALEHHCAICGRPLNHQKARFSCFGKHAEPCPRYHQHLFRPGRGRSCATCGQIDEEHHKRHVELAETLKEILKICGEDPFIGKSETAPEVRGRTGAQAETTPPEAHPNESSGIFRTREDASPFGDEAGTNRKERKVAKALTKAASRPKVTTTEELQYMESIIHPCDHYDLGDSESGAPVNVDDVRRRERIMRGDADAFKIRTGEVQVLKVRATREGVILDFEAELARIESALRITVFISRNEKNRGLQGKDFRVFVQLVGDFRNAVVDDLIHVKLDRLEIEMRRAGYLRYTTRASNELLEERYEGRDWKTGERIRIEEEDEDDALLEEQEKENSPPARDIVPLAGPDQRHLLLNHKRIAPKEEAGDDDTRRRELSLIEGGPVRITKSKASEPLPKKNTVLRIVSGNNGSGPSVAKPPKLIKGWNGATNGTYRTASTFPTYKAALTGDSTASASGSRYDGLDVAMSETSSGPEWEEDWESDMDTGASVSVDTLRTSVDLPSQASSVMGGDKANGMTVPDDGSKKAKKKKREADRKARRRGEMESSMTTESSVTEQERSVVEAESKVEDLACVPAKKAKKAKREAVRKTRRELDKVKDPEEMLEKAVDTPQVHVSVPPAKSTAAAKNLKPHVKGPNTPRPEPATTSTEGTSKKDHEEGQKPSKQMPKKVVVTEEVKVSTPPITSTTPAESLKPNVKGPNTLGPEPAVVSSQPSKRTRKKAVNTEQVQISTPPTKSTAAAESSTSNVKVPNTLGPEWATASTKIASKKDHDEDKKVHTASLESPAPSQLPTEKPTLRTEPSAVPTEGTSSKEHDKDQKLHAASLESPPPSRIPVEKPTLLIALRPRLHPRTRIRPGTLHAVSTCPLPQVPTTTTGRFADWTKYTRYLTLDTLTDAFKNDHMCVHQCPFVSEGFTDCPYHGICADSDPDVPRNHVVIVYPWKDGPLCTGPFTRVRADKLLTLYNEHDRSKGQFMILNEDVWRLIIRSKEERLLAALDGELDEFDDGCIQQAKAACRELTKENSKCRQHFTKAELIELRKRMEPEGIETICYCKERADEPVNEDNIVECGYGECKIGRFHRKCLKDVRPEAYSRWYCYECGLKMDDGATKVLMETGGGDVIKKCPHHGGV